MPSYPDDDDLRRAGPPSGPPGRSRLFGEVRTAFQPARLALASPRLLRAPRGDGRIVVVMPGWRAPEVSTAPIRGYLRALGHDARSWGLGTNLGDVQALRDEMIGRVDRFVERSGRPVDLVGWSLGGVVAREIARARPERVRHVVTYGSPVIDGPLHTVGAASYSAAEVARIRALQRDLDSVAPISTPITAIFTRNDGIVDWRACIDRNSLDVTMVEVSSTHVGLGLDPDVWLVVAEALAPAATSSVP